MECNSVYRKKKKVPELKELVKAEDKKAVILLKIYLGLMMFLASWFPSRRQDR